MSAFPVYSMHTLLERHPDAEQLVQVRIFDREGCVFIFEGAASPSRVGGAFVRHALGLEIDPAPDLLEVARRLEGALDCCPVCRATRCGGTLDHGLPCDVATALRTVALT